MPPAAAPSPALFHPSAQIADALISAISDPALSFENLAAAVHTTPEALAAWMIRPEVRERIESLDSITTWRTRLTASAQLNSVVRTLSTILDNFCERSRSDAAPLRGGSESADNTPTSPPQSEIRNPQSEIRRLYIQVRAEDNARKSAALLLRLANVRPVAAHDQLGPATLTAPARAQAPAASFDLSASEPAPAPHQPITRPTPPPSPPSRPKDSPTLEPTREEPSYVPSVPWVPSVLSPDSPPLSAPTLRPTSKHTKQAHSPTHLVSAATREHWP